MSDELIADLDHQGIGLGEKTMAEVEARRAPIQLADLKDVEASPAQSILLRAGYRSLLVVPLLGPEGIIGVQVVRRKAAPFPSFNHLVGAGEQRRRLGWLGRLRCSHLACLLVSRAYARPRFARFDPCRSP